MSQMQIQSRTRTNDISASSSAPVRPTETATAVAPASPASAAPAASSDNYRADSALTAVMPAAEGAERVAANMREMRRSSRRARAQAPRPTDLPDPAPMAREAAGMQAGLVTSQRADGQLFVNGPGVDDPRQGVIGDCYLIAAMSAVAQHAPEQILDRIRENANGSFTVRFSELDKDGKASDRFVTVDRDLLRMGPGAGEAIYGDSSERDAAGKAELWVPILEKAYAQFKGGFEKIGNGGNPAEVFEALTGKRAGAALVGTEGRDGENLLVRLQRMLDNGWSFLKEGADRKEPLVGITYLKPDLIKSGILPLHAYTITGVEEKDGKQMVTVRNPAPYRPELDDPKLQAEFAKDPMYGPLIKYMAENKLSAKDVKWGTFSMPYEELKKAFDCAFSAPIHAPASKPAEPGAPPAAPK